MTGKTKDFQQRRLVKAITIIKLCQESVDTIMPLVATYSLIDAYTAMRTYVINLDK